MKQTFGLILAAGFGTRLKPWTDHSPKALFPIEGIPMLERVVGYLKKFEIHRILINIHHFGEKIIEFSNKKFTEQEILISDEREKILDTGGAVLRALQKISTLNEINASNVNLLVHNVDIISDADLRNLLDFHNKSENDISLLVSDRASTRKLLFDENMQLIGWHNLSDDTFLPRNINKTKIHKELAFSGIYVVKCDTVIKDMKKGEWGEVFPIMQYFLSENRKTLVKGFIQKELNLIDIGKPANLSQASVILRRIDSNINRNLL